MRMTDFFLVLPTFVLAIILAPVILDIIGSAAIEVFGIRATLVVIVIVIGITSWATTARIIRSQTLSMRERMFVDRARVIGVGHGQIMRRHILPNVMNLIVAQAVLTFAAAVFIETTLSFIGLGDPFPPSWGQLLDAAQAPARRASARGGTSPRRPSASSSSSSRSPSSATRSTTSSTRSGEPAMTGATRHADDRGRSATGAGPPAADAAPKQADPARRCWSSTTCRRTSSSTARRSTRSTA